MATRVNKKFVVILAGVLIVACAGVVGAFVFLLYNTGADLARMGDKQMAAGRYKDAGDLYAKAVNKEQTNVAFLRKWIEAVRKQTPETQTKYMAVYHTLGGAMRQLAISAREDVAAQCEYLEMEKQALDQAPFKRESKDSFIREADTLISQHVGTPPGSPADKLKRYRGIARLQVAVAVPDATQDYLDGAKEDLDTALALDPSDVEAAMTLERYYMFLAAKADVASRTEEANGLIAKGGEVVAAFQAKNPQDPSMMLVAMRRDLEALSRETTKRTDKPDLKALSDQYRTLAKPKLETALAAAMALPPEKITSALIGLLRQTESTVDPASRLSRSESLTRAALAARPQDEEMIATLADILETREDHAAAVTQLEQLVAMPDKPVSLAGALLFERRTQALFSQGLWTVRLWRGLSPGPEKEAALARVRDIRGKLAAVQDANSPGVLLLDAELAFIDGDERKADRLLEQFNNLSHNTSPDALMVGAEVAMRLSEPGLARERLEKLMAIQPTNLRAAYVLAGVYAGLQDYERAERLYSAILEISPDNKAAAEGLKLIQEIRSGGKAAKVDDPVTHVLIVVDSLMKDTSKESNGPAKAETVLLDAITAQGQDPRLVSALAKVQHNLNKLDAAIATLEKGLAANPDSKELKSLRIAFNGKNRLDTSLALIDAQDWPEAQRLTERYMVYRQAGLADLAAAELDKAVKAAPDDRSVLELVFMATLESKDFVKAQALSDRAQKEDLDKAGGATYRARLESARGNNTEAVRIMEEFAKGGGVQLEAWRLLGRLQNQVGRSADAVISFRKALQLRPSDVPTIKDLLNTQVVMRHREEALTTARQYLTWAEGDDEFLNVWLSLEAAVGNREMVIQRRERIVKDNPYDRDNLLALAALYMDNNRRAEARPLLDGVRAKSDGLDAVNLDAGWYWADSQKDKAKSVFESYISSIDKAKQTVQPFLVYAQFLLQRRDAQGALDLLERAREFQTPGVAEADKSIADTYLGMGREDDAIPVCRRVVDAKADTRDHTYLKRMIEAMVTKQRYADADKELAPLLTSPDADSVVLLIAADSRAGQDDQRGRKQLLDRAVTQFPNDPMVFVKRGEFLAMDPTTLRDAADDFSRAIQLEPNFSTALRLRASVYDQLKETDKSIADLRSSLLANPGDFDLLQSLVTYLVQNGKDAEATGIANEVMERRRGDASAGFAIANIFAGLGKWEAAARFAGSALELDQQDAIAQRYLDCLLNMTPPNLAEANRVLIQVLKPQRVGANAGFKMAQAKVQMREGKEALAARSASDALHLLNEDNAHYLLAWFNDAQWLQPDKKLLRVYLNGLMQEGKATEWLTYFRATLAIQDKTTGSLDEGVGMLRTLLLSSKNPALREMAFRTLGATLYSIKQFSEAAVVMKASLSEFPKDSENMNNLAYMLAKDLNNPTEALPLALEAAKIMPGSAEVLDTLGLVQLIAGKTDEAVATLTKALSLVKGPSAAATITIHLADAFWTQGKKEPARNTLETATKLLQQLGSSVSDQTKTDLEDLRKKISAP